MAEGWANHLRGDRMEAWSAGIEKHGMNEHAVQVMAEAGVDLSSHYSKLVSELPITDFDYVITVCDHAHTSCPVFPGAARVVHHGFDDPPRLAAQENDPEKILAHYRRVRDEIRDYILTLPDSLENLENSASV